jgi:hypothetical protein
MKSRRPAYNTLILLVACVLARGVSAQEPQVFYPSLFWPDASTPEDAQSISLSPGEARDDLQLLLTPGGGTLEGRVVSDGGDPLGGVLVVARSGRFLSHSFSDGSGSFSITGVAPGNTTLRAWTFDPLSSHRELMPFYAPSTTDSGQAEAVFVAPGLVTTAPDLVLSTGARIIGSVVSSRDEEQLPGLRVEGHHMESGQVFVTHTKIDGSFLLQGLFPGSYVVVVRGRSSVYLDEYVGGSYDLEGADILTLEDPQDIEEGALRLEEQGRILGKVSEEDSGLGIPNVEVIATEQSTDFVATTMTDEDGFYTLDKLRAGTYIVFVPAIGEYWLDARTEDQARRIEVLEGENISPRNLEGFTVGDCAAPEALGVITGQIEVDDIEPADGWTMIATSDSFTREVHFRDSGEYHLDCLLDGDYIVSLFADSLYALQYFDGVPFPANATLVTVEVPDTTEFIDFEPARGARIGGVILTAEELLPIADAPVQIHLEETGTVFNVRTDEEGRFLVGRMPDGTGLPEGTYKVSVDSFSTGHIVPTPLMTLAARAQTLRREGTWVVRVIADLPFGAGPFLVELLRRRDGGPAEVVSTASPPGTGGGNILLEDWAPPQGLSQYKVAASAPGRSLESPWLDVEIPAEAPNSSISVRSGPNPSRSKWTLHLELPAPNRVTLDILSIDGRLLWRKRQDLPAGGHRLTWDGRGREGQLLPAGIYTYVLSDDAGARLASGRVVWVR